MPYDEKTAERVRKLLAARRNVAEKKLMGGLCFMVNGNMCVNASRHGGILVRVGPDAFEAMASKPHARTVRMGGGRLMTGFVYVEPEGFKTDAALAAWVQRALDFVGTLPRNAAKGKAPKARKAPAIRARRMKPKP